MVHATDIVVRGLDFAGVIDEHRPLQGEAARLFGLLRHYRILRETGWPKTTREYDDCELFRAIFLRAERSFRLAAQRRPEEFSREISRASTSLQDKKKWLEMLVRGTYAYMRDLMSMVTEPISGVHEMMQPTLNDFSQLREMISSIRTRGWTNLIQIIDADVEDTRQITIIIQSARAALVGSKEVVADRRSQLEKLRDETADTSEKEGHEDALDRLSDLEKKLDAVLKSLSRLDADLSDFFTHRAGSVLMKGIQ